MILRDIGRGFVLDGLFLYKAAWSILFGVAVTAVIDVFVDRDRLAQLFGGRGLKSTGLATLAGSASSACTYGAVTVGQTLFKKGASVEATYAFVLAATNIVFELGILIWILLGGAFLAGELVAGVLLVVGMWALVRLTLPKAIFAQARRRLAAGEELTGRFSPTTPSCGHPGALLHEMTYGGTTYRFCSPQCQAAYAQQAVGRGSVVAQLSGLAGWYRLAWRYTFTLQRIYKSVAGGFLIAGFVTLIPATVITTAFLAPTSPWRVVEDAALGVGVGMVSFIASIGIVPFAAALWFAGAGFAGVLGVIIADNITIPVLGLWRRFYGAKATAYTVVVFYTVMMTASVAVNYLFASVGALPHRPASVHLSQQVAFHVDYTFWLTLAFVVLTAAMLGVRRAGERRGAVEVTDPVCGLRLERRHAHSSRTSGSGRVYFCSSACAATYDRQHGSVDIDASPGVRPATS